MRMRLFHLGDEAIDGDIGFIHEDLVLNLVDTIISTIEWTMTELMCNPKTMLKVKREIEEVTIGKGKPIIEESDIGRLPYLEAIVKETFRLHPSVPFLIPRKADIDVQVSGYTIPKGSQLLINVWAIDRDATSTWKNPNVFSPERFLGSEIDFKDRHFELIPFGAGRRMCPGLTYAMRVVFLMLASLIHGFDWKLENGIKPEQVDKEEQFGMVLLKSTPLRIIPINVNRDVHFCDPCGK